MKRIVLISLACVCISALQAQTRTDIRPIGLDLNLSREISVQTLPAPDMASIHAQDAIADAMPGSQRFAYPVFVNYTLDNSGTWHTLENGDRLWQLRVTIPAGADVHVGAVYKLCLHIS